MQHAILIVFLVFFSVQCFASAQSFVPTQTSPKNEKKAEDTITPKCAKYNATYLKKVCKTSAGKPLSGQALEKCKKEKATQPLESVRLGFGGKMSQDATCATPGYLDKYVKGCKEKCEKIGKGVALYKGTDAISGAVVCARTKTFTAICRDDVQPSKKQEETKKDTPEDVAKKDEKKPSALDDVLGKQQGGKNVNKRIYTNEEAQGKIGKTESGVASRYGDGSAMDGSEVTSSGAIRDNSLYHMASQHYPDGTVGMMTGPNGETIPIVVNNSGKFYDRYGRNYDLSPAAAEAIGISRKTGVGNVTFTPTYVPTFSTYKKGRTDYVQGIDPARANYYMSQFSR